jgi:hypothetical protein
VTKMYKSDAIGQTVSDKHREWLAALRRPPTAGSGLESFAALQRLPRSGHLGVEVSSRNE